MEFRSKKESSPKGLSTPGSKGSARPKPYTSLSTGGYGRNVRRDNFPYKGTTSANATPNRYQSKTFSSRTDRIMANSILQGEKDPPSRLNTWLCKKEPVKRPLATNNQAEKKKEQKKEYDPYNVFSDGSESDDEIFLNSKKTLKSKEDTNQIKDGVRPSGLFAPSKEAKARLFADTESPKSNFSSNKESPKPNFSFNKESPKSNFYSNKENTIFGSPDHSKQQYSFKSYGSAKRKFSYKNRFKGVSPVKVERLYGEREFGGSLFNKDESKKENEKENIPVNTESNFTDSLDSRVSQPHLIGFPNTGNTCYLNAVVQSLLAIPSFTLDLQHLTSSLSPDRTSLFHSLGQLLHCRNKLQVNEVKAKLRLFKDNLVGVDNSFSGFKMQDANEFLTRLMDTIKDEVERCHMTTPSPDHPSTSTDRLDLTPEHPGTLQTQCYEPLIDNGFSNPVNDPFDDLFGPSKDDEKNLNTCTSVETTKCTSQRLSESNTSVSSLENNERTSGCELENKKDVSINKSSISSPTKDHSSVFDNNNLVSSSVNSPKTKVSDYSSEETHITTPKEKTSENLPRNPIKDNFEFHLMESYRCLSCSEVVSRNQEYFGLYVNLPEKDTLESSVDEDMKLTGNGLTTIQDAIDGYLKADERDLNCEKCGHDKAEVVTAATSLPRILVVQLKRYEFKPEMLESFKVSSRVWIDECISLDKFVTEDVRPVKLCDTDSSSVVPKAPKQATLTVRNLSSELNVLEKQEIENSSPVKMPFKSPVKPPDVITVQSPDQEDEELQEVMRRSMDDMGGPGMAQGVPNQEEDEIQQAIRLSLQDVGMSFTVENQEDSRDGFEKKEEKKVTSSDDCHSYRLMSIISHFGQTTKTGHYVSDVYNLAEKSWFHYDDETVTPIKQSVVTAGGRQKNGYIFFYIHSDLFEQMEKCEDKRR